MEFGEYQTLWDFAGYIDDAQNDYRRAGKKSISKVGNSNEA